MKDFLIKEAKYENSSEIATLMNTVYSLLEDKTLYVCDDVEYVKTQLSGGGFGVVAENDGKIVGCLICRYPGTSLDNLGRDISLPEAEFDKVVHIETSVVHPLFNGNHLQQKMMSFAETLLDGRIKHCLATVSPYNIASLKSCERCGFQVVLTKLKYGGLLRNIMYKKLP